MSVLSDKDILERWEELFPYNDNLLACLQNRVQPASVDLQLDKVLKNIDGKTFYLDEKSMYVLQPEKYYFSNALSHII